MKWNKLKTNRKINNIMNTATLPNDLLQSSCTHTRTTQLPDMVLGVLIKKKNWMKWIEKKKNPESNASNSIENKNTGKTNSFRGINRLMWRIDRSSIDVDAQWNLVFQIFQFYFCIPFKFFHLNFLITFVYCFSRFQTCIRIYNVYRAVYTVHRSQHSNDVLLHAVATIVVVANLTINIYICKMCEF